SCSTCCKHRSDFSSQFTNRITHRLAGTRNMVPVPVACFLLLFHQSGRPSHFLGKRGERVIINLHLPPQTGFLELLLHPRPDEDAEEEDEGHMAQDTPNKQVFERHW